MSRCKRSWTPESKNATTKYDPACPSSDARNLVWRMCCRNPSSRISLSSVVRELDALVKKHSPNQLQPEHEQDPLSLDSQLPAWEHPNYDRNEKKWTDMQMQMKNCDKNGQLQLFFDELKSIRGNLLRSTHPLAVFDQFDGLVRDFGKMVSMWRERTRNFGKVELMWRERTLISKIPPKLREIPLILLVSAARVSNISFRWRLRYLWVALGESEIETRQREARWEKWSSDQIEIFKSGVTDAYVVLNASELDDLDNCLYAEMEYFLWEYTPDEVKVLQMVHDDVKNKSDDLCNDLSGLKPDWFIPRHELVEIERYNPLGSGGFGRVFRAKWLNSDVVLKVLLGDCDEIDTSSSMSLCSMTQSRAPASSGDDTKQTESMKMFRREVDVWFGFNHPHVVQLFGACHIDIPFFVCEYAANGTLVGYLKKHPDELWSKLHEAALGVQYLHARNVVHGDLKGNNVVIGGDMKAKVTDFGLSLTSTDDGKPLISGAWHWVAPECLRGDNTRLTFASDVYSLGMCIIEALRVVEAVKSGKDFISCRPWRLCDINAVKYHVKQGKIPPRPEICDDNQWHLVERMCVLDPQKRIKISTVVDELERLASVPDLNRAEISTKPAFHALEVISAAQGLLARLQGDSKGVAKAYTEAVYSLYGSMWDRLEQVHRQIQVNIDFAGVTDFCSIIGDADKCTRRLEDTQSTSNLR